MNDLENIGVTIKWIADQDAKLTAIKEKRGHLTEEELNSVRYLLGKLAVEKRNVARLIQEGEAGD